MQTFIGLQKMTSFPVTTYSPRKHVKIDPLESFDPELVLNVCPDISVLNLGNT